MRSRTAGVMTTLMRNGRDRRLEKPVKCHARKERVFLVGTRSADHIRASGHSGCIQRPDTWLHPNASLKRQIPLAPRAPSIHGPSVISRRRSNSVASLIGHSGSSAFRPSTTAVCRYHSRARASLRNRPEALPSWDSRTRRNNLSGGLASRRTVGPSDRANSPHPSSREGHHSTAGWSLGSSYRI